MKRILANLFRFLPVQLFLLHFRKYQPLLIFWLVLISTLTGHFASHFGAATLFLAPEYLGNISFMSMLLLGLSTAVFVMAWHITTFIIHSHRIPFMGATRQAFLKYCINNSLLPLLFLTFYSVISFRFMWREEQMEFGRIMLLQSGFYLGFILALSISFVYFFRVDRNLLKLVIGTITNPSRIREIIPYDTIDYEFDIIKARTYLDGVLRIEQISNLKKYNHRLLSTVLRRHHRNAITAFLFAFLTLALLGIFMDEPLLRIPAGAGFMILFAVMTGLVGAVKYLLRSWALIGWILIACFLSMLARYKVFDLRSVAYGINYDTPGQQPVYDYEALRKKFDHLRYTADMDTGIRRLESWKSLQKTGPSGKPPLIVIGVSGGGSRSAYWTFRVLQYLDSMSAGKLYDNSVLITGASGGMIGAAYWRNLQHAGRHGLIDDPYNTRYQENIGRDLLNAIVFSFVSMDLVVPFNKAKIAGRLYGKDRGYALEKELSLISGGLLDQDLGFFKKAEASGATPQLILNGTIINDGRRLMISALPVSYLTQPVYSLTDSFRPPVDAVDFARFFEQQDPYSLRLTSALRMNATFPLILPVIKLPSHPEMNIMDAGLRDNFGQEVASRYLLVFKDWIRNHTDRVIYIQIRDTRESEVNTPSSQHSLTRMIADPLFVIQSKWNSIQSYYGSGFRDLLKEAYGDHIRHIRFEYIPHSRERSAPLNFHLSQQERSDLYHSIHQRSNQASADSLIKLLR